MSDFENQVLDLVATGRQFVVVRRSGSATPILTSRQVPSGQVLEGVDRCQQPHRIPYAEIKEIRQQ